MYLYLHNYLYNYYSNESILHHFTELQKGRRLQVKCNGYTTVQHTLHNLVVDDESSPCSLTSLPFFCMYNILLLLCTQLQ